MFPGINARIYCQTPDLPYENILDGTLTMSFDGMYLRGPWAMHNQGGGTQFGRRIGIPIPAKGVFHSLTYVGDNEDLPREAAEFFRAAALDDTEELARLLEAGVRVDTRDADEWTALLFAASRGNIHAARFLIRAGAEVDGDDVYRNTPLMAAAITGDYHMAELLIVNGASRSYKNRQGLTAADLAWANGYFALHKWLKPEKSK